MYEVYVSPFELYHHGIQGMKWGVRRYQNPDGSLTEEGRLRYRKGNSRMNYQSGATRRYGIKYGTQSEKYKKSAELDEKIAEQYRDSSTGSRIAKTIALGSTGLNTYEMSRATGRGKVESFLRSALDVSAEKVINAGLALTGAKVGQKIAETATMGSWMAKLNSMSPFQLETLGMHLSVSDPDARELFNIWTTGVANNDWKGLSNAYQKAARGVYQREAERASRYAGEQAARVGAVVGRTAGVARALPVVSRGHELSAQQAWLRNNYINKGSLQEQKVRKQERREEKRRAKGR